MFMLLMVLLLVAVAFRTKDVVPCCAVFHIFFNVDFSIFAVICVLIVLVTCRRVSEDRSGDDVGAIDAGDLAPPSGFKVQEAEDEKEGCQGFPTILPIPSGFGGC